MRCFRTRSLRDSYLIRLAISGVLIVAEEQSQSRRLRDCLQPSRHKVQVRRQVRLRRKFLNRRGMRLKSAGS